MSLTHILACCFRRSKSCAAEDGGAIQKEVRRAEKEIDEKELWEQERKL
jgi:hypothetical protein